MLYFNALVLLTTNICNLKCRHCYPTSGPSRSEVFTYGKNKTMTPQQAERYIRQLPGLTNVHQMIHLAGGESTLFTKEFQELVSLGGKYGIPVSMTTNCWWAKSQEKADEFIEDAKKRGMKRVEISLSVFHQEFLDISYPLRAIRACKKFGLTVLLRPVVTKSGLVSKTLAQLPDEDLEGVTIAVLKCLPVGRAKEEIPAEEFLYDDVPYGGCQNILHLTVRQDGSVFPCCAGADITRALCLGNANEEPLFDILARADLDPLLAVLTQQGPRYLAELLREAGGKDFTQEKHVGICHLCNDLFINDEIALQLRQVLDDHFKKRKLAGEADAFSFLGGSSVDENLKKRAQSQMK